MVRTDNPTQELSHSKYMAPSAQLKSYICVRVYLYTYIYTYIQGLFLQSGPVPSLCTEGTAPGTVAGHVGHFAAGPGRKKTAGEGLGKAEPPALRTGPRRLRGAPRARRRPRPPLRRPFSRFAALLRAASPAIRGCAALRRAAGSCGEPRGAAGGIRALPDGAFRFPGV